MKSISFIFPVLFLMLSVPVLAGNLSEAEVTNGCDTTSTRKSIAAIALKGIFIENPHRSKLPVDSSVEASFSDDGNLCLNSACSAPNVVLVFLKEEEGRRRVLNRPIK